jgi:hypothetical protein
MSKLEKQCAQDCDKYCDEEESNNNCINKCNKVLSSCSKLCNDDQNTNKVKKIRESETLMLNVGST